MPARVNEECQLRVQLTPRSAQSGAKRFVLDWKSISLGSITGRAGEVKILPLKGEPPIVVRKTIAAQADRTEFGSELFEIRRACNADSGFAERTLSVEQLDQWMACNFVQPSHVARKVEAALLTFFWRKAVERLGIRHDRLRFVGFKFLRLFDSISVNVNHVKPYD